MLLGLGLALTFLQSCMPSPPPPHTLYQAVLGMGLPAWPQVTPSRGLTVPVTQGGDRVTKGNSGACWESPFTRLCTFGAPTLCPVIFGGFKEGGNQPYPGEFILWWRWRAGHRGAHRCLSGLLPTSGLMPPTSLCLPGAGSPLALPLGPAFGTGAGQGEVA